jgi:hypothetical protein
MLSSFVHLGDDLVVNLGVVTHVELEEDDEVNLVRIFFVGDSERSLTLAGRRADELWHYVSEQKGL